MADSDELPTGEEDDGGGAVKSFLEHLEDLRWVLIKSGLAIAVGMFICLSGVHVVVAILKWPLLRAQSRNLILLSNPTNQVATIKLGAVKLGSVVTVSNQLAGIDLGTNHYVTLQMVPVTVGSNILVSLQAMPTPETESLGGPDLIFLDPGGPFLSWMGVAFYGGFFLASPFVLYFVGQFVMPALKIKEKKYFLRGFWFGTVLFFAGASVAYFVVMPSALKFAQQFSEQGMGVPIQNWNAPDYFHFVIIFMLGMGLGFELPVVLLALVKIGILDYGKLKRMRRYMIIINLVLGAILTTPEVFTQVVMAVCLQFLFELSVWIAWYWERQERRRQRAEGVTG